MPAAHVHDPPGLVLDVLVEQFDDHLVDLFEITRMRSAAAPDVHLPVDVDLRRAFGNLPQNGRITKDQFVEPAKSREVRYRNAVSAGSFGIKQPFFR